jgi:NADPH-dependent 2,4-dienoyl-CoA reductase/sulfur reductase-like enzyme
MEADMTTPKHRIVIIGGGFGGIAAAQALPVVDARRCGSDSEEMRTPGRSGSAERRPS